ncbi:hypothetical protein ACFPOE_17575 [Caenimonas terrae]|uniref:DUF2188 domain-containing protein n=1 Tax=Caenimonas terrae TaxID=696074 RepID=A0ABW0NK98_9BURK
MPWTAQHYPPAMRALSPLARQKAIAIANAILAEGADEGKAIRIGIAKARQWAAQVGAPEGGGALPWRDDPFDT